jgi:nucleoside-diphosphate-sugar epimerase
LILPLRTYHLHIPQITGITGHVGFKVLVTALQAGYTVRGAIRREAQIDTIKSQASIRPFLDQLSFVIVPDITVDGAFDAALKDVTYVLHIASPLPAPVSNLKPTLPPTNPKHL